MRELLGYGEGEFASCRFEDPTTFTAISLIIL